MPMKPCICSWHDCDALHASICEIAPASHAWCQNNIRIAFSSCDPQQLSVFKYALLQAIYKHIPVRQLSINSSQKNLFIAPHHFPICLLQWREQNNVKAFTKLLSVSDMGNIDDSNNGRQLLSERSNSASQLMRKHHLYDATKYKNMFVQSPMNTRSSVNVFLASSRRRVVNRIALPDNRNNITPVNVLNTRMSNSTNDMRAVPLRILIQPIALNFSSPEANFNPSGLSTVQNLPPSPSSSPPPSPSIVMNIKECHTLLDTKLKDAKNDITIFQNKKSTKSIAKLLVKYHENFDPYVLSNKMFFYPCLVQHYIEPVYAPILCYDKEHKSQIQMLSVRIVILIKIMRIV